MDKIKIIGMVLSAISVLVTAAKSIIKFIDYLSKIRSKPATA